VFLLQKKQSLTRSVRTAISGNQSTAGGLGLETLKTQRSTLQPSAAGADCFRTGFGLDQVSARLLKKLKRKRWRNEQVR